MAYTEHPKTFVEASKIQVVNNPKVSLSLTADDWQLYGYRGREIAAENLNRRIESAINSALEPHENKFRRCTEALDRWSHYGAADTEGYDMLRIIFYSVFGENYDD